MLGLKGFSNGGMTMQSNLKSYQEAMRILRAAENLAGPFAAAVKRGTEREIQQRREEIHQLVLPRGIWEHRKNGRWIYVVRDFTWDSEGVITVPYTALYEPEAGRVFRRLLVDPKEGFLVPVDRSGEMEDPYLGPRFGLIESLSPVACDAVVKAARSIAFHADREGALAEIARILESHRIAS